MKERDWLINTYCGDGCYINRAPLLWWQSAISFAGSCTLSKYFPSSYCYYHWKL